MNPIRPTLAEKAQGLLADRRVIVTEPGRALVAGDGGAYTVRATRGGVLCECLARGRCSHALAAMARSAELEGGGHDER